MSTEANKKPTTSKPATSTNAVPNGIKKPNPVTGPKPTPKPSSNKSEVTLETNPKNVTQTISVEEVVPTAKEVKKAWKLRHQKYYQEHVARVVSLQNELKGSKMALENVYQEMKATSSKDELISIYLEKAEPTLIINENFSYDVLKKNKSFLHNQENEKFEKELEKIIRKSKSVESSLTIKKDFEEKLKVREKEYEAEVKVFEKEHVDRLALIDKNKKSISALSIEELSNHVDTTYENVMANITNVYKLAIEQERREYRDTFEKGIHPNTPGKIIELRNVIKYFTNGDTVSKVLKGVTVSIDEGDFLVILGPSGSGKTTTLNITSGLDSASDGEVIVAGHNLIYLSDRELTSFRAKYISFIFQQYNLLPTLTVLENIKTGEELQKDKSKRIDLGHLVKDLGLEENIKKYPYQLSGGQQQRVAIGRALAKNPKILFADEPTGALDEETSRKILELLVDVNKKYKTTLVVVTHNPQIAKIANKVIKFKNGHIEKFTENKNPLSPSELIWEV